MKRSALVVLGSIVLFLFFIIGCGGGGGGGGSSNPTPADPTATPEPTTTPTPEPTDTPYPGVASLGNISGLSNPESLRAISGSGFVFVEQDEKTILVNMVDQDGNTRDGWPQAVEDAIYSAMAVGEDGNVAVAYTTASQALSLVIWDAEGNILRAPGELLYNGPRGNTCGQELPTYVPNYIPPENSLVFDEDQAVIGIGGAYLWHLDLNSSEVRLGWPCVFLPRKIAGFSSQGDLIVIGDGPANEDIDVMLVDPAITYNVDGSTVGLFEVDHQGWPEIDGYNASPAMSRNGEILYLSGECLDQLPQRDWLCSAISAVDMSSGDLHWTTESWLPRLGADEFGDMGSPDLINTQLVVTETDELWLVYKHLLSWDAGIAQVYPNGIIGQSYPLPEFIGSPQGADEIYFLNDIGETWYFAEP